MRHSPVDEEPEATREEIRQAAVIAWFGILLAFVGMLLCSLGHTS
jgi:hypothetical protein